MSAMLEHWHDATLATRPSPGHSWLDRLSHDGKCDETAKHTAPVAGSVLPIVGRCTSPLRIGRAVLSWRLPGVLAWGGGGEGVAYSYCLARPAAHVVDSAPLPAGAHRQCDLDRAGPARGAHDPQLG